MRRLLQHSRDLNLEPFHDALERVIKAKEKFLRHPKGNYLKFKQVVDNIPDLVPQNVNLDSDVLEIGSSFQLDPDTSTKLRHSLMQLCPWRKGPFNVFGIHIDAEWQSWLKWNRVKDRIRPLKGARILDIGSSSGYYMFRMAHHGPAMVLGLEPQSAFYYQYLALQKFLRLDTVFCLPVVFNELPSMPDCFDMVFCMGILYHRRSPVDMLCNIRDMMKKGGQIVVETLVIESESNICLFPRDRYAKMRNIYFIPDIYCLDSWLSRAGFSDIRCIDITPTTNIEQRKTEWIQTESLKDFLDPENHEKTVEGYPAPVRAIFTASA